MKCFHAESCVRCTNCGGGELKEASLNCLLSCNTVYFVTFQGLSIRIRLIYKQLFLVSKQ
jgi:hypothetical protein